MSNPQNHDNVETQFELNVLGLVCGVEVRGTVRFQAMAGSFPPDQLHKASRGLGAKDAVFWRTPQPCSIDLNDPLTIMKMILSEGKWRPDGTWPPDERNIAKYSPTQPRAPEGISIGGQWVKEGEEGVASGLQNGNNGHVVASVPSPSKATNRGDDETNSSKTSPPNTQVAAELYKFCVLVGSGTISFGSGQFPMTVCNYECPDGTTDRFRRPGIFDCKRGRIIPF